MNINAIIKTNNTVTLYDFNKVALSWKASEVA